MTTSELANGRRWVQLPSGTVFLFDDILLGRSFREDECYRLGIQRGFRIIYKGGSVLEFCHYEADVCALEDLFAAMATMRAESREVSGGGEP